MGPLCLGTLTFYGFFAGCGALVSGDFEILLFLPVCEDFASLRFFPYVWGLCVYGDFEILCFSPVCGPCVGDFENFQKKISNREKSQVWGFEMAVTQRKKMLVI